MEEARVEQPIEVPVKKGIFDRATLLAVNRKWPPLGKSINNKVLNSNADPSWISASKYLYKCQEISRLFNWDQTITAFIESRCLPFPLKRGIYLLPKLLYPEVEMALVNHRNGMVPLIDAFIEKFDEIVNASKERLKDQFNQNDYPTKEAIRNMFKFEWRYLKFGVDETIEQMDREQLARETEKYEADIQEGSAAIRLVLRTSFQEIVAHLFDVLTPEAGGRKKTIRKGGLDPLNEFVRMFNPRDLTDDAELKKLVDQAKALAAGISPEAIRSNESTSQRLQEGFGKLKAQIDTMVADTPIRKIRLD